MYSSVSHSGKPTPANHNKTYSHMQTNQEREKKDENAAHKVVRVSNMSPRSISLKRPHHKPSLDQSHLQNLPTSISIPIVYIEKIPLKGNRRSVLLFLLEGLLPVVQVPRQKPISLTGLRMVKGEGRGVNRKERGAYCTP